MNECSRQILTRHLYDEGPRILILLKKKLSLRESPKLTQLADSEAVIWTQVCNLSLHTQANLLALAFLLNLSLLCGFPNYPHSYPEPLVLEIPIPHWAGLQYHFVPAGVTREFLMATISCPAHQSMNLPEFIQSPSRILPSFCSTNQSAATSLHLCSWAMGWEFLWEWIPRNGIPERNEHL